MFGFYKASGRAGLYLLALAALVSFGASQSQAQIAFPENGYVQSVAFITDSGSEVQLVGTHSFGMYRSIPGAIGKNKWAEANTGLSIPLTVNDLLVLNDGSVLLGASGSGGQQTDVEATGLFSSADGGLTWTSVLKSAFDSLAVHTVQAIAQSPVDDVIFISADDGNIFLSQDNGATWVFNGRLPGGSSQLPWSLLADASTAGTVYAGTLGYGVYVSRDYGGFWEPFTDNATLVPTWDPTDPWTANGGGNYVFDLEFNPAATTQMFAATAKGVWRFNDVTSASGTWTRMAAPDSSFTLLDATTVNAHPEVRALAFDLAGTTLYQATWGFGVLSTTDFLGTPTSTQVALRGAQVSTIAVSPSGNVVAGTSDGVTTIISASATANEPGVEMPDSYGLSQNYPNPFNPTTSISFDLPQQGNVSLALFDVLGRKVADLASGEFAAGTHAVTLDASRLQSGLYIYRLDAGGRVMARTMSLVK